MTATELKIPISCRVYPDLKSEIVEEAQDEGLTTSMYLEKILQNRHESKEEEEDEVDFVNVYQYEVEIDELKAELESLQEDFVKLEKTNQKLASKNESLEEKLKGLRLLDLDDYEVEELERLLEELQPNYPSKTNVQLVLASIHAALKNEDSILFIYTPSCYFK